MASRPITIEFIADVAQYLRETKNLEVSTDDIAEALVGVSNSADELERKLSSALRAAEADVQSLESAVEKLPTATSSASTKIDHDFDKVGADAADAGREVGSEFQSNLGESLSSGSFEDLMSGTLGGLVGSMQGPLGLVVAGVAGVAALAFGNVKKEAEKLTAFVDGVGESIRGMYEQGILNANNQKKLEAFNTFLEDQADNIGDLEDAWTLAGVDADTYLTSLFEGGTALDSQRDKLEDIISKGTTIGSHGRVRATQMSDEAKAAKDLLDYLNGVADEQDGIAGDMSLQASASQELARQYGLVDTNLDGVINDLDKVKENTKNAKDNVAKMKEDLEDMPHLIPVEVRFTATGDASKVENITGGAYAVPGGQRRPIYTNKAASN